MSLRTPRGTRAAVDVVVVGAGIAGLYMLFRLRQLGLSAVVLERGDDLGGAWYWNRYPGARCDVDSLDYSYSFDGALRNEWEWTERFAGQPEILAYLDHVADRFALRSDLVFGANVVAAEFDDRTVCWWVRTEHDGALEARYLVLATGVFSTPTFPDFPGLDCFEGELYTTANWPRRPVRFTGKQVAVIGTGASGTQLIPAIVADAAHVYAVQRTPRLRRPLLAEPDCCPDHREAAALLRVRIQERLDDPELADRLIPRDDASDVRRLCTETGYYECFNRDDVTLLDLREEPLVEITSHGVMTRVDHYAVDMIVLATGFAGAAATVARIDVRGADGRSLEELHRGGGAHLGLMPAGFSNLFIVTGPGSPASAGNDYPLIERQVDFIGGLLAHARTRAAERIGADRAAQSRWTARVAGIDAERYTDLLGDIAADSYSGFSFSSRTPTTSQERSGR